MKSNHAALEKLREAVLNLDEEETRKACVEALETNVPPIRAIEAITESASILGEKFGKGEIYIADLMMLAEAMKAGMSILLPKIQTGELQKRGTVLMGTVAGDIHNIGKDIVLTMLRVAGFDVYDLGVDVSNAKFSDEVEKNHPDIVGASALMTTTYGQLKELIAYLEMTGIRNKVAVIIGGAPVTSKYAQEIGADGYGADASEAVALAERLMTAKTTMNRV